MTEVFADSFYWIALMWSFTDCISFEVMRRRGITLALSADHHFRQAGFQTAFDS